MKGKITQWKDGKGFGFIVSENNGEKLFFHISAVKTNTRRPQVGDTVLYESMRDSQDRPKAKTVVIEGVAPEQKTAGKKRIHTAPPKKDALDYISIVLAILSLTGAVFFKIVVTISLLFMQHLSPQHFQACQGST